MKKLLAFALILSVLGLVAGCKKTEQPPAQTPQAQTTPQPKQAEPFKPHKKNKKGERNAGKKETLELYNESTLVTTIPGDQYKALTDQKVRINNKDLQAILLRDLLKKYKMQGKNVILTGVGTSATLTWEQANADNLFVYLTPKSGLKLYSSAGATESGLPKKLIKITTSATTEASKTPPAKQPAPAKKDETKKSTS
jgi:hypothetical protein